MIKFFKIACYILILIIILLLTEFLHSFELVVLFFALILAAVIPELSFLILYKKSKIKLEGDKYSLNKNSKNNIIVSIRTIAPIRKISLKLEIKSKFYDSFKEDYSFSVSALVSNKLTVPIDFINPGRYKITIKNIKLTDIFGIFTKSIDIKKSINIDVMPDIVNISTITSGNTEIDLNQNINSYSFVSGDISDIRAYKPGDRLNAIHWKTSAKKDDLFVKEFEKNGSEEFILLFDFNKKYLDTAFDLLYSVGTSLNQDKRGYYVMWLTASVEELNIKYISSKEELNALMIKLYNSYPIYENSLTINTFRKQFGKSRGIYIGEHMELI